MIRNREAAVLAQVYTLFGLLTVGLPLKAETVNALDLAELAIDHYCALTETLKLEKTKTARRLQKQLLCV